MVNSTLEPSTGHVARIIRALAAVGCWQPISSLDRSAPGDHDTVPQLLETFAGFVEREIAPLNRIGDRQGSRLDPDTGRVRTPDGFVEAYRRYVSGDWLTVPCAEEFGGGGFPWLVGAAMQEILASANMAFSLCPMLTQSAIELLSTWGTQEQRARYLHHLVAGEWAGTMNLTESDAGSDLGAVRTMARPNTDGTWRIDGTKIFITWGEHDLTENIVHLVLARTPQAPGGTRGLSLFAVPAKLVGDRGEAGEPNGVRCVSVEAKLGIHASPTCTMEFDRAQGELVGERHGGMKAMFTMMNVARLSVGLQGVALAERAYQRALHYAGQRQQGRLPGGGPEPVPIIRHPDVRRTLISMRAAVDAARLLVYTAGRNLDAARSHPDPVQRARAAERVAFLVPLAKAWPTEVATTVTSWGIGVHGGAGYIEETGAAQDLRDARITSIYEGTNGIQAIDLLYRKLELGADRAPMCMLAEVEGSARELQRAGFDAEGHSLARSVVAWRSAATLLVERRESSPLDALAGAAPFLAMTSSVVGGGLLARRLLDHRAAGEEGPTADRAAERFFLTQMLPQATSLLDAVKGGNDDLVP